MEPNEQERWATLLEQARRERRPIPPLTDADPELSVGDAYAIAQRGVATRLATGRRLVGRKIGLTSDAVQQQLGVDQPDYGALLDDMQLADGAVVPADLFVSPRVELEFAFHLDRPLTGPGVTRDEVAAATASVQPAIEIVDSRIADWRIALADTIADNASSGAFVLGGERLPIERLDLGAEVALLRDGEPLERGRPDAVLGDPCLAVAWLANALGELGTTLEAGQIVLSGACTRMAAASPGDAFSGDFGPFGTVTIAFAAADGEARA
jgi:2-keto-4-pentenoate hydratase